MGLMNLFNLARVRPHIGYRFKCEIWPHIDGYTYDENYFGKIIEFAVKKITQPVYKLNTENKQYFGNTAYVVPIFKFGETNMEITFEETDDMEIYSYLCMFLTGEVYNGFHSALLNIRITQFNESMSEIIDKRIYICKLKDISMPSFNNTSLGSPIEITTLFKVFYMIDEAFDTDTIIDPTVFNAYDNFEYREDKINRDDGTLSDFGEADNNKSSNPKPHPSIPTMPKTDDGKIIDELANKNLWHSGKTADEQIDEQLEQIMKEDGDLFKTDDELEKEMLAEVNTEMNEIRAQAIRDDIDRIINLNSGTGNESPVRTEEGKTAAELIDEETVKAQEELTAMGIFQPVLGVTNEGKTAAELIDEETAAVLAEFDEAGILQPEPAKTFVEEEETELARIMEEDGDLNLLGEQNSEESDMKPQDIHAPEKQLPSNPAKRTGIYTGDDEFFIAIANSYETEISKKEGKFGQYFFDMNDADSSAGTGNAGSGSSIGQRGGAYDKMGKIKVIINGEELEFDNMTKFDAAMQTAFGGRQIIIDTLEARGGGTGGYNPNADLPGAKSDLRAILDEPGKGVITDRNGKTAELSFDESTPYLYLNVTFSEDITRKIAETDMAADSDGWSDQIKSTIINDYKMTGGAPNKVVQGMLHMGHAGGSMGTVWRNFNKDENNIKLLQRDIIRGYFSEETLQALRNSVKFRKHSKMYISLINKYGNPK